jgi:hypothetical protein
MLVRLATLGVKVGSPALNNGDHVCGLLRLKAHCVTCLGMYKSYLSALSLLL